MIKFSSFFSSSSLRNIKNKTYFNLTSNKLLKRRFLCTTKKSADTITSTTTKTAKITMLIQTLKKYYLKLSPNTKVIGFLFFVIVNYPNIQAVYTDFMGYLFKKNLKSSIIEPNISNEKYVERKDIEKEIKVRLTSGPRGAYTIIYGNKGVGKSELMSQCLAGKKCAVRVEINTSAQSPDDVVQLILKKVNSENTALDFDQLKNQMKKLNEEGIYPIIVFDVERNRKSEISAETILAIRGVCKSLAPYCHCFIVLSEANGIIEFGNDVFREKFIYIDELSTEQAKEFMKKNNYLQIHNKVKEIFMYNKCSITDEEVKVLFEKTEKEIKEFIEKKKFSITDEEIKELFEMKKYILTDEQMKYVFDNIGTNAQGLIDLLTDVPENKSLEKYVTDILSEAHDDLKDFQLQKMLKALKEHPEGISKDYFDGQYENGIKLSNFDQVSVIMKLKRNTIIYRKDTKKYHLLSTAHKTALKSYDPIITDQTPQIVPIPPKKERTWFQYFTGTG